MRIEAIVQYATLVSLLIGILWLAVTVTGNRRQITTQISLTLTARYDDLLNTSPASVWTRQSAQADLPEPSDELTVSVLRYCTLVSFTYFLFQRRSIPKELWALILPQVKRTLRSPLFVREWKRVRSEFESFPDFVTLVVSIQESEPPSGRSPSTSL